MLQKSWEILNGNAPKISISTGNNGKSKYFYFKNIIIIIYSTPQAFFASISAISLYLSPE